MRNLICWFMGHEWVEGLYMRFHRRYCRRCLRVEELQERKWRKI